MITAPLCSPRCALPRVGPTAWQFVENREIRDALHEPKMMPKLKLVLLLRPRAGNGDRSAGLHTWLLEGELSAVRMSERARANSGPESLTNVLLHEGPRRTSNFGSAGLDSRTRDGKIG
jgi:hypothetical protein